MRILIWFREDLRVHDNLALFHACKDATRGAAAIYFVTPSFWQKHDMAPVRIEFLKNGLLELQSQLQKRNISLHLCLVEKEEDIYPYLITYAKQISVDAIYFNKQYEVDELQRDNRVISLFHDEKIIVKSFDDQIIFPARNILSTSKEPFKVFTAYKRAWFQYAESFGVPEPLPEIKKQSEMIGKSNDLPDFFANFNSDVAMKNWPAGEKSATNRLNHFVENKIHDYHETRDFPALDGTSKLSPYLSAGMISPRLCFAKARMSNQGEISSGNKGVVTWINELIWREFYKYILIHFPHVSKNQSFKKNTQNIPWEYNETYFKSWCSGETGFPFVDAAMRQLLQTGWMHNRLRMVVSMFLSKTLFIDWHLGERFFMQHLIDGDLAANNGGWQWSASTGVDAAPYFRIFNPIRQSERFDPKGDFIRQYVPELKHLKTPEIFEPCKFQDLFSAKLDYPKPIVNHTVAKERVIKAFKIK